MPHSYILPGMGADARMYPSPWGTLPDALFLDWPPYQGERTLAEIAARVITAQGIAGGEVVMGSSLGGMVAAEIANQVRLSGLVLIGSAVHPGEVSRLLTVLHPLADLTPLAFLQALSGKLPGLLPDMFRQVDAEFIRAACHAICTWPGLAPDRCPLLRLHGRYDPVIPLPAGVDHVLPGGHLIALTHAETCVAAIMPWLTAMAAGSSTAPARRTP
jgi:pimeloyl-ACP methyl ester carboxylesterase